jgi:hypothetical protein
MFQRLKDHKCGLSNSMGRPLQITDSGKPSADSGNGLAAIDPIAGIGLLLHLKQISNGMPISAISQQREAYCRHKSQNRFPAGNAGNLLAMNLSGLSAISLCSGSPIELEKPH